MSTRLSKYQGSWANDDLSDEEVAVIRSRPTRRTEQKGEDVIELHDIYSKDEEMDFQHVNSTRKARSHEMPKYPSGGEFRPRMPTTQRQDDNNETKRTSTRGWAETKKPVYVGSLNDEEVDTALRRSSSKWNAAKPADSRDSVRTFEEQSGKDLSRRSTFVERKEDDDSLGFTDGEGTDEVNSTSSKEQCDDGEVAEVSLFSRRPKYDVDDDSQSDHTDGTVYDPTSSISYVIKSHAHGTHSDLVQCVIKRDRSSLLYPTYELYLEGSNQLLIVAMKMNLNRTSNYHLFDMTRGQAGKKLSKKSGNYLGKLRSKNLDRTEYTLITNSAEGEEVAGIMFDKVNMFNQFTEGSQPRKMSVVLPHLDSSKVPIPNRLRKNGDGSMIEMLRASSCTNRVLTFESKDPVFDNGNYRLNFNGRVTVPSVKNFQLVPIDDADNIVMQFGKIADERFHLDFKLPLNAFQAFALALCQFNL